MELQPLLHDLLVAVHAPTQAWSASDGQVRARGAQGFYDGDLRVLSRAELAVGTELETEPEAVVGGPAGPGAVEVVALLRSVDEPPPDPTLRLRRRREVLPGAVTERLEVAGATVEAVRIPLVLALASDLATMEDVKAGRAVPSLPAAAPGADDGDAVLVWRRDDVVVRVHAPGAVADLADPTAPRVRWDVELGPGRTHELTWRVEVVGGQVPVLPASAGRTWSRPTVRADDHRLAPLLARSLEDLEGLRMCARFAPDDVFVAAGAPWFFTLFGRDSLWAARMLLPLGTELAAGTLRTLAARQGRRSDPATAEQPGKILHEVRATHLDLGDGTVLPPVYFGTVDATPLWVCVLHDAWRWGMPADEVEALLPAAEAALEWMVRYGDADGDGFLEYLDETGTGLANQGWKDSGDSVQWRDGTLATGPIALSEVQAYAHEAALGGAALLEAFGRPGADRWRAWAADLRERFRAAFWVDAADGSGRYPAIALDADKRP
ncbi:MAG TPA: glycogen debranching N-terminal domain-containing protein, partial [Phototrophicaceae bacterium]|nr:glycogen debranching N-terminal domain-containing protein [Phototrophicaceae bacterium]